MNREDTEVYKQEPYAEYTPCCTDQSCPKCKAAIARPRQWAGLTDEEITELSDFVYAGDPQYVRLIESKLREKNMT
jgi:hypothetical protein